MNFLKLHLICKYEDYFFTLPDCISWWLRCKVYKNLFSPDLVQFKSKINQDVFMQIFILQRQSKLDEVLRQTGEADGLGGHSSYIASPHHTPGKKRYFATTEHDIGARCGAAGCANTGLSWKYFWTRNYFRNQKPRGWGRDALLLITPSCCPALGRIPRVEGGLMLGGTGAKGCGPSWLSSSWPPSGKKSWTVSYDFFFFCCKETRQTIRATWSCISSRLNTMIIDFF